MAKDTVEYRTSVRTMMNNMIQQMQWASCQVSHQPQPANKLQKLKVDSKTKIFGMFTVQNTKSGNTLV